MRSNHFRFSVRSDIYESFVSLRYKITRSPKLRWTSSYENSRSFIVQLDISCMVFLSLFSRSHTYTRILSLSFFHFIFSAHLITFHAYIHAHTHPIIVVNLNWLSKFDKSGTPWLSFHSCNIPSLLSFVKYSSFFSQLYSPIFALASTIQIDNSYRGFTPISFIELINNI